jgi:anti-sigma factor RsiW
VGLLVPAKRCEQAREAVSLQLDGELSPFERARLDAHLQRCGQCRAFYADAAGFTTALRQAPLEVLGRRVTLPRRAAGWRAPNTVAAAAAALAAAFAAGALLDDQRPPARAPAALGASLGFEPVNELAWFKRFPALGRSDRGHTVI